MRTSIDSLDAFCAVQTQAFYAIPDIHAVYTLFSFLVPIGTRGFALVPVEEERDSAGHAVVGIALAFVTVWGTLYMSKDLQKYCSC